MLYTFVVLLAGIYFGQEYNVLPSIKVVIVNSMVYLKNLRYPIEDIPAPTIYEKIVGMF